MESAHGVWGGSPQNVVKPLFFFFVYLVFLATPKCSMHTLGLKNKLNVFTFKRNICKAIFKNGASSPPTVDQRKSVTPMG